MSQNNTNNNKSSSLSHNNDVLADKLSTLASIPQVNVIQDLETSSLDNGENGLVGEEGMEGGEEGGERGMYRRFTPASYQILLEREAEELRKESDKKNNVEEGRLVDGQLKFGDDDTQEEEEKKERDPLLAEGNNLPEDLPPFPNKYLGLPVEEIDPYIKDKSFVVIAKKFRKPNIFRFSATKAFFLLSPNNPVRIAALYIATNQFFDFLIILTILMNCVLLPLPEDDFPWLVDAEYVFLAIYTLECIIKLLARGMIVNEYTYLRDGWNWLDFFVVLTSYITLIIEAVTQSDSAVGNVSGLRTFRVLRALRTVSVIPGLKTIIQALLKSLKVLAEVIVLTFFCMMVFSMFALQVYAGILRQKCVTDIPEETIYTDYDYVLWIKNESNWLMGDDDFTICGNASGAGSCPEGYTCLPDVGDNPRFGYSNFDNFGWAMLNSFQLITLDFWEDPYNKIIRANGPWNIIFFIMVIFFGSYYLINLMLAVVSMSYEEEAITAGKRKKQDKEEKEEEKKEKKKKKNKEKEEKKKKEETKEMSTHLKVMSSVNGADKSPSASSTNLSSVGNGSMKMRDTATFANGGPSKASGGIVSKDKGGKEGMSDSKFPETTKLGVLKDSTTVTANSKEGYVNPLVKLAEDDYSMDSDSNNGDPPRIVIRAPKEDGDSDYEDDDDDEELVDRNCECCSRCCRCYIPWLKIQNSVHRVVSDLMFELLIAFIIGLNVLVMAMAYYPMSESYENGLKYANYVFIGIFTIEAIVKMIGLSKQYYKSAWNIFDLIIVILSFIDIGLEDVDGLSVLRAFRLLRLMRVFKLAQTWDTMRRILSIIVNTMGALGNLTLVLGIIIYIFAVIGQQLFSKTYTADKFAPDDTPRWNFDDFFHSLFLIFRVLCGEWIEPLWDCMRANGQICMVVFLPTLILGNFMILNLFLALLLNAFATDSLNSNKGEKEDSKVQQGWKKIKNLFKSKKAAVRPQEKKLSIADLVNEIKLKLKAEREEQVKPLDVETVDVTKDGVGVLENDDKTPNGDVSSNAKATSDAKKPNGVVNKDAKKKVEDIFKIDRSKFGQFPKASVDQKDQKDQKESEQDKSADKEPSELVKPKPKFNIDEQPVIDDEDETPGDIQDCWPAFCYKTSCLVCSRLNNDSPHMGRWMKVRTNVHKLTEHKAFEYFILIIIFASSISLCFEDIYLYRKTTLQTVLRYLDIAFLVIFGVEMLLKFVGIGFKKYFTSFWTILDFTIVVISVISIAAETTSAGQQISVFKSLRTLRALRPLRAISRWQSMRIVVNALVSAIPAILNVAVVCGVFWLIFSIAGVQLFSGKFYKCIDEDGNRIDHTIVNNKSQCEEFIANGYNYRWYNSKVNFDNVGLGYLALFQVATFEGWMELIRDATDSRAVDEQPYRDAGFWYNWYFVFFIIVGSFITLNLFIGVIIDNFNVLKKKYEGGFIDVFLTSSQKNYYNTMKKLGTKKPQKTIKRPKNQFQAFFFDVSMSVKFELAVVVLILLNMVAMSVEHYQQSDAYSDALDMMNIVFTTIFFLEAIVKIVGLRWHYFRRAWNVYDFIICVVSLIGVIIDDLLRSVFITPTLLRVIRVFRIGRVLRLIKAAKGLRKLLFALVISLPALFNIGMLLCLFLFIYAIFGMSLFGTVKITGALDDVVNFQTFGNSFVLLFRLTTAGGWNDILDPLMIDEDDGCNNQNMTMPDGEIVAVPNGDCGNFGVAILFMTTFVILTFLVIINMYIAVILENYSQAHEQEEVGITEDDFEMFYVTWERYDPHATQFIKYEQLSDFVGDLELPLGIPKPNEIALVAFDLPIYNGDRLHCLDILTALVKHVLGGVEETEEFKELKLQMDEKYKESFPTRVQQQVCTTTMGRKKEDVAAKTLQRAWRQHRAQQNIRKITALAMQEKMQRMGTRTSISIFKDAGGPSPKISPRPQSPSTTKTIKAANTAKEKKKTTLGNKLQLPKAADIKLPSEKES